MRVDLSINSGALSPEDVQGLTQDFCRLLNSETEIAAALPERPSVAGERGDPVTLGVLALTFMSSGAAVALFEVAKSIFERNATLEMVFEREDGKVLKIRTENVSSQKIDQTMALAREFFRDER